MVVKIIVFVLVSEVAVVVTLYDFSRNHSGRLCGRVNDCFLLSWLSS